MFFFIKAIIAISAFIYRYLGFHHRNWFSKITPVTINGQDYFIIQSNDTKTTSQFTFSTKVEFPVIFKLSKETKFDTTMKYFGLSQEFQTGDHQFDKDIYLASDNRHFNELMAADKGLRQWISMLLEVGATEIVSDGKMLWVSFIRESIDHIDSQSVYEALSHIQDRMKALAAYKKRFFVDPFVWKALFCESLIYSAMAYSYLSFFDFYISSEDLHLNPLALVIQGVVVGIFLSLALVLLIFILFKGSSRGHRILAESLFVLGLSVPVGGIGLVSDLNTSLDESQPILVQSKIVNKYTQRHRRKRSSYTTYHFVLATESEPTGIHIPTMIKVSYRDYSRMAEHQQVELVIMQGFLHHPWLQSIRRK